MEPILTLQNISAYDAKGRALVPPVSLAVLPGERVRVIAERPRFEALARIIGGLADPDSGEVAVCGPVGYIPPEADFWEEMSVLDNAAMPLAVAGVSKQDRRDAALRALDSVGLGYAAHTYPKSLGLCEQRLAALARALVGKPALLLLAEPVSMLDEKETARFLSALSERWTADRFAVLYSGRSMLPPDRTLRLQEGE